MPIKYTPPSPEDLAELKSELGLTGKQMAELAWLAGDQHWRKYTNPNPATARQMSSHMLFTMAAQLELSPEMIEKVLNRMRSMGATIDLTEPK
ncbi:XRE family transcriptional regulator [Paraburkholderia adhaesiva]|uniref:XRE family transcriptional regulator n=1 Tax=Paraburkholderia adhaesiva TaxID=2883244 RepID=UPI001F38B67E|nr:XRE family transcriptional regulator [Paraburkholderia adhaesiva]